MANNLIQTHQLTTNCPRRSRAQDVSESIDSTLEIIGVDSVHLSTTTGSRIHYEILTKRFENFLHYPLVAAQMHLATDTHHLGCHSARRQLSNLKIRDIGNEYHHKEEVYHGNVLRVVAANNDTRTTRTVQKVERTGNEHYKYVRLLVMVRPG